MRNFMINVAPKTEGGRIPVALAGQIMMDIQEMLSDIGEYLIRSELGIQNSLRPEILSKFTLFMDGDGGISIGTSTNEHIVGSITEGALDLMEDTMDAMGSGAGGYWMEDNYIDPFFRNHIIYDIVALSEHINGFSDCVLTYGSPDNMKTFGQVDVARLASFMKEKGMSANSAALGLITTTVSKSKGQIIGFECGKNKVKLHFRDRSVENVARTLAGKGPVYVAGRLMYSEEGNLMEIRDVYNVTLAQTIRFRKLIAATSDISVKEPVVANISFDGRWTLSNDTLGISVTKDTWDDAVQEFNDFFMFLWTEYMMEDKELEGEDAEIRDALKALI